MSGMSRYAYYLQRGSFHDPECSRTTFRLQLARTLLNAGGADYHVEHCKQCKEGLAGGGCWDECKTVWSEWVTPEMFEHAWALADLMQTESARARWVSYWRTS